ncbi:MAG: MOSC domain-containing protein [Ignavibacteria bacterium]|nr:MOSC domain-containing protein [Ignavibacteria bacterium]
MYNNQPLSEDKDLNTSKGRILAISVSKRKGTPKSNVDSVRLIEDYGIENDAHAGKWHRQVSFLAIESIQRMRDKGLPKLRPGAFAENLTTEFIDLPQLKIGSVVKIGSEAELEITQIGKECHAKCAIYYKVGDCVMPSDGIFGIVIKGGIISKDDEVIVIEPPVAETSDN